MKEADVQIYAIGIYEQSGARGRTPEEMAGPGLLSEIAEQTGGRQYPIDNLNELPDIAAKIGIELRNQYILGYTPQNQMRDGKYRHVQVKLVQPRGPARCSAFWKLGYYAPCSITPAFIILVALAGLPWRSAAAAELPAFESRHRRDISLRHPAGGMPHHCNR